MPTIDLDKLPEGTLILVPASAIDSLASFWRNQLYRDLTPAQLAAELDPKLPPVGSVWRVEKNDQTYMVVKDDPARDSFFLKSAHEFPSKTFYLVSEFAAWVREHGAVCVYDPSKESP